MTLKPLKRYRTRDRGLVDVLTTENIGKKRALTPEGFLLCMDVPVARLGTMLYGPGEVPVKAGADGTVRVTRDAEALFDPVTLASYVGKPVVNDHPDDLEDVNPSNWRRLAVGITLNPRRGEGEDSDVMLADLLITDAEAIRDIQAGKREVSAGYESDYEDTGKGTGRQLNIMGNHVALVEKGRCGPRCAIGDHQPKELQDMGTKTTTVKRRRTAIADSIRKAFADVESGLMDTLGGMTDDDDDPSGDGDTHIHIHAGGGADPKAGKMGGVGGAPAGTDPNVPTNTDPKDITQDDPIEARFAQLEAMIKECMEQLKAQSATAAPGEGAPPADGTPMAQEDPEPVQGDAMPEELEAAMQAKTNDSAALETYFRAVLADAEILVPGFRLPTFDTKAKRKITIDAMCNTRRSVLKQLGATTDGSAFLTGLSIDARTFETAKCADVAVAFRTAAGAKRLLNNHAGTRDDGRMGDPNANAAKSKAPRTLAELNKLHREFYTTH